MRADTNGVLLVAVVVVMALAAGLLAGGSPRRLTTLPLRSRRWVLVAIAAELAGGLAALAGSAAGYDTGVAIGAVAAAAFCLRNLRVPGVGLVLLGVGCNALVVALNGAMPVSSPAAGRVGVGLAAIASGSDPRHDVATATTRLRWLGDVVPVALPGQPEVASPGDVLVAAGLGQLVLAGSLAGKRPRRLSWPRVRRP